MLFRLAISLLASTSLLATTTYAHSTLLEPRSRQTYAYQDGSPRFRLAESDRGIPLKEYAPFGFQAGGYDYGACGRRRVDDLEDDYTFNYVDPFGDKADWVSQATYQEGQIIDIMTLTLPDANHQGYFEFFVCVDDVDNPVQECFDENPLTFINDEYYGATPQPGYPTRGYMVRFRFT